MDYNKLCKISDDWNNPSKRTATAPTTTPSEKSVLDNMEVRAKIADSAPKEKVKVMILDDAQIKTIMSAPRDKRRKVLSRMTDSQRRRFLARYREITRVKDDATVTKLNYVNLDSILNDCLYVPDEYHLDLLHQWTSTYSVPEEIDGFVQGVEANNRGAIAANFDNYINWCESNNIDTVINLAKDVIETPELPVSNESVEDSLRKEAAEFRQRIKDSEEEDLPESKELTEDVVKAIQEAARADMVTLETSEEDAAELSDYSIDTFVNQGYDYGKVAEIYNETWNTEYKVKAADSRNKIAELEAQLSKRRVMDAIIDEIAEKPLIDENTGEEVKPTEERPVLAVLSEALEEYVNGDSSLLEKIASTTLNGNVVAEESEEVPEEPIEETPESEDADETPAEPAEVAEPEDTDEISDSSETEVQCPIEKVETAAEEQEKADEERAKELAQLLLAIEKGTENGEIKDSLNNLIASLSSKVPALAKYNFYISDCAPVCAPCETAPCLNPPLSRAEYYDMYPICPDYFDLICAQYPAAQLCPSCNEYSVGETSLCVNPSTCPQSYYPYNCTLQEIADLLGNADAKDYTSIINENCIPMSDALKLAALTNNLSFIDNNFYKKHVSDDAWAFDEVPACLKEFTNKSGSIRLVTKATDSTISLFGQNFELC